METTENQLLTEYKKYDYLNKNSQNPLIKILVSYIKPSFLFKSDILTPIHLGRAIERESSKDGVISDEDINWLHENCIGDDDFEGNISHVNRRVGFLTGTYWAWKNYEKLGNPKYFGSFGYRKLFESVFLKNIKKYDFVLPIMRESYLENLEIEFINFHGINAYQIMQKAVNQVYQNNNFKSYMMRKSGYYHEIYVLKQNLFFQFCEWIFPILEILIKIKANDYKTTSTSNLTQYDLLRFNNDLRDIAFIIETLTGFWLFELTKNNKNYIEIPYIIIEKENLLSKNKNNIFNLIRTRIGK